MPQAGNPGTKHEAQTWAIYHRIEAEVAEGLIKSGEITRIAPADIHEVLRVNDRGEPVLSAVIVPGDKLSKFHQLLAEVYAK